MSDILKPCPFCGGHPIEQVTICDSVIRCSCDARIIKSNPNSGTTTTSEHIRAWNTRIDAPTVEPKAVDGAMAQPSHHAACVSVERCSHE